jgi:hypothetical protein
MDTRYILNNILVAMVTLYGKTTLSNQVAKGRYMPTSEPWHIFWHVIMFIAMCLYQHTTKLRHLGFWYGINARSILVAKGCYIIQGLPWQPQFSEKHIFCPCLIVLCHGI